MKMKQFGLRGGGAPSQYPLHPQLYIMTNELLFVYPTTITLDPVRLQRAPSFICLHQNY